MKPSRRKFEEFTNSLGVHHLVRRLYQATAGRQHAKTTRSLRGFYASLIRPGSLVFDIGANTGVYASIYASLGAHVVALEPNTDCVRHIELSYRNKSIEVIQAVAGPKDGLAVLNVSDARDDISSLSENWINAIKSQHVEYQGLWNRKVRLPMLRIDTLIEHYGFPAYIKIDVEGFEESVLDGLSTRPPLLSFEYHPAFLDATFRCLDKNLFSGDVQFNLVAGNCTHFHLSSWLHDRGHLKEVLSAMRRGDIHGDIFVKASD